MMIVCEWVYVEDGLPENRRYVIIKHNRTNLIDRDDQNGTSYSVVKFIKGLSLQDRDLLSCDDPRKTTWKSEDEGSGNNLKPYYWSEFGPCCYFGQDVIKWAYIND